MAQNEVIHERTPLLGNQSPATDDGAATGAAGDSPDEETTVLEEVSGLKFWTIMGACWVGVFLGAIDSSIMATLSAPISSEFNSLSLVSWLATAYLISNAACQPISGRLTDIFGRGPGLVFSNLVFAAGNLICGLSRSADVMILGRVVAGIGGGGLMTISTFLGTDLVPLRKRGVIQGIGNICFSAGSILGGVFGGLINDTTSWGWRLAFLIQVPPVLVSAAVAAYLIHVPPKVSNKSYLARIDFTGALSLVACLVLLLLGLNTGGNVVPWTHPLPLTTLPLSFVSFVAFIIWEARASQPVIPVRLLFNRTVFAACMTNLLCNMVQFGSIIYIPMYLEIHGFSASRTGLVLLFSPLGICICSLGSGYIMQRTGRYIGLAVLSVFFQFIAMVLLSTLHGAPIWPLRTIFFFLGSGLGGMLTTTLLACLASVEHSHQASITSATYAFRSVGSTLGITIGSAIYQNVLKGQLWNRFGHLPGAAEEIARIRDDMGELKRLPEGWYDGVMASFQEAFHGVWLLLVGLVVLALISVSLLKQHKLHSTLARTEVGE
ncbi:major facilitator superfamily domain-containing protein [Xylaria sp. CBS 124048]|nr:major facilitator superfamily domain-containing protein [Xylaria sp. CBS 124048]